MEWDSCLVSSAFLCNFGTCVFLHACLSSSCLFPSLPAQFSINLFVSYHLYTLPLSCYSFCASVFCPCQSVQPRFFSVCATYICLPALIPPIHSFHYNAPQSHFLFSLFFLTRHSALLTLQYNYTVIKYIYCVLCLRAWL